MWDNHHFNALQRKIPKKEDKVIPKVLHQVWIGPKIREVNAYFIENNKKILEGY
jgi:hypothetical protein